MPKLAVGYPWSSPFIWTDVADRNANMQAPPGWDMRWFRGTGWCPARRHIHIGEQALQWGADLICIVGADQVHPEDMFPRLLARIEQGCEVISALVPCRGYVSWQPMKPFQKMGWRFKPTGVKGRQYRNMQLDWDMVEVIDPAKGDLQRVDFIGSGVIMFHRDHLLALKRPWFKETIHEESFQRIANQDAVFSWRLRTEAHAQIWVDTTIQVRHLHAFQIDETYPTRFADWAEDNVGDPALARYGGYLYRQTHDNKGPHRERLELVLKWAGDLKGKRVLEVGSDDGTYLEAFAKAGASLVVGCDPYRKPKITLPQNVSFVACTVEQMNGGEPFDLIHMGEVLEHLENPGATLAAVIARWPDATYILSVPNFWARDHKRTYTWESFAAELEPYLTVDEVDAIAWEYVSPEGTFTWFLVKGRAKRPAEVVG